MSNETGGAVTEADARAWATALLRSSSYDDWALEHLQDGFLVRSGLLFQARATEGYSVHVTEYWYDGQPGFADLGTAGIDPFSVTTPPLSVRVLQEEGVPIG